jgi:predicted nucleic acid-binding protein
MARAEQADRSAGRRRGDRGSRTGGQRRPPLRGSRVDRSALVRLAVSPDAGEWAGRIERGLVRITTVTRLEIGYSARSAHDLRAGLRQPPVSAMPVEYLTPAVEDRAAADQH